MNRRSESLLLRDAPRSPGLGLLVAVAAVAATTAVIYPLGAVAPAVSLGVVYLLAVLLISTYWGLGLGLFTAVASAATFNWFHIAPTGRFHVDDSQNWVALAVFLTAATLASTVAGVARSRATEAKRRRQEADLSAAMARTLLGGVSVHDALPRASQQLAQALELEFASIETEPVEARPDSLAIPLEVRGHEAVLLVPADLDDGAKQRLRERVVPSLSALLAAALDRERLQRQVVETEALRRSDVLKTALLRAVSHDLRSPLTAIMAAGDAVRSSTLESGDREELASMIVDEAARLSHLVEQLLDLSRLQARSAEPRRDWCSIEEIVGSAVDHIRSHDGDVEIRVAIDHALPFIEADAAQLERVIVNLLENASRFSAGRPVDVRAVEAECGIVIQVIDQGAGISEELLPIVFEPFRRGDDESDHAGTGLGLAIVKGLVEANGGQVRAEPRRGRGTVFTLEFPVPSRESARSGRRSSAMTGRPRVLVVDDELQILRALKVVLREAGFDVEATGTARGALDAAAVRLPDAAIVDLMLPDGDGVDVCTELRSWSEIPILVLSAIGEEAQKVAALEAGADDYVTKPFGPRELVARLNAVLRRVQSDSEGSRITIDGLEVDFAARTVRRAGDEIRLTPIEYKLLATLIRNRGRLMTHRSLLTEVWGPQYTLDTQVLRTHIANLRGKIAPEGAPRYIRTESGVGYRFMG